MNIAKGIKKTEAGKEEAKIISSQKCHTPTHQKKKKKTSQRKPVEAHSEPTQISKMESFPTIDNSKRLLAIVTKLSILDVCRVPGHVCDQLILFRDS